MGKYTRGFENIDYYSILEVSPSATGEEIKASYRRLIKQYHPDLFQNPVHKYVGMKQLQILNLVYEVLGDPQRRMEYDAFRQKTAPLIQSDSKSEIASNWENRIFKRLAPVLDSLEHGRFSLDKPLIWLLGVIVTVLYWIYLNYDHTLILRHSLENLFDAALQVFFVIALLRFLTSFLCSVIPWVAGYIQKGLNDSLKIWTEPLPQEILKRIYCISERIETLAWGGAVLTSIILTIYFQSISVGFLFGFFLVVIIVNVTGWAKEFMQSLEKSMGAIEGKASPQKMGIGVARFLSILGSTIFKAVIIVIIMGFLLKNFSHSELSIFGSLVALLGVFFALFPGSVLEKIAELCAIFLSRFLTKNVKKETDYLLEKQ